MCLVEVEKTPKLQTACTTPCNEGMVVRSQSPVIVEARRSMLEFLLANHPLDCPVCDKGGECELQDMVFRYGAAGSRFHEEKLHVPEQKWSPVVYFDAPRCILCYRCVRVCGEGMGVSALGIVNRGAHAEIAPNHGDHLDCEECGMCIDICPVGALTSGAYRYKARPWEIKYVSTICAHCGDGCKTTLSVRNNKILRGNNRDRSGINDEFLCIKGRYAYDFVEHPERLRQPLIRQGDQLVPASWEEAIRKISSRWSEILARPNDSAGRVAETFGVIGSNHTTNEENYLLQKFARTILKTNHIDHHRTGDYPALFRALWSRGATPGADSGSMALGDALRDAPSTQQAEERETSHSLATSLARSGDLANAPAILLVGSNPTVQHPLLAWRIREGCRLNQTRLYVIHSSEIPLVQQSCRFLPVAAGHEKTAFEYLLGESRAEQQLVGRTPGGREVTAELLGDFRSSLMSEKGVIVVFGDEIIGDAVSLLVRLGTQLPGATRYIALGDYSNSRGASDMGLLPDLLPGYRPLESPSARAVFETRWGVTLSGQPGWTLDEMLAAVVESRLESLYVVGANPLKNRETGEYQGKTFLVVQDLFLHETVRAADVVLPAASAYEKSGTVTNTCGEMQRLRKATEAMGTRTDLEIFSHLASAIGAVLRPSHPDEVLAEIRELVPGYEVPLVNMVAGGAELVAPSNGFHQINTGRAGRVYSSQDTLFTSGTLGRYSDILRAVPERTTRKQPGPA